MTCRLVTGVLLMDTYFLFYHSLSLPVTDTFSSGASLWVDFNDSSTCPDLKLTTSVGILKPVR